MYSEQIPAELNHLQNRVAELYEHRHQAACQAAAVLTVKSESEAATPVKRDADGVIDYAYYLQRGRTARSEVAWRLLKALVSWCSR